MESENNKFEVSEEETTETSENSSSDETGEKEGIKEDTNIVTEDSENDHTA